MRPTWDDWFLDRAADWATRSKDPSTQCGAVIVAPDKTVVSTGYNGFPRRIHDDPELLHDRDEKLRRMVHAEINAILNNPSRFARCSLYTYPFPPCVHCAAIICQTGIIRVVSRIGEKQRVRLDDPRHGFVYTPRLFQEAGIHYDVQWEGDPA